MEIKSLDSSSPGSPGPGLAAGVLTIGAFLLCEDVMARIRYLKPEFFSDEDLAELPFQTRLAFAGLWCYADKSGRLEDRPKFLKAMIFPYDNVDMEKQLSLLSNGKHINGSAPFIQRYQENGTSYIQILTWDKHQKPHHTEADSKIPPAPPLKIMEKGMGKEKQEQASAPAYNRDLTVKERIKSKHGDFNNVLLTDEENQRLIEKFGEKGAKTRIDELSEGIASKGYRYKDHYATILSWERKKNPDGSTSEGAVERIRKARERDISDRKIMEPTEETSGSD